MRTWILLVVWAPLVGACHHVPQQVYADAEGVQQASRPPLLSAGRVADTRLLKSERGKIVAHTAFGVEPGPARVSIRGGENGAVTITAVSNAAGVLESELVPGECVVEARRVGAVPQSLRIRITRGFADTISFVLGQR